MNDDDGERTKRRTHDVSLFLVWLCLLGFLALVIWQWISVPFLPDWLKAGLLALSVALTILGAWAGSDKRAEHLFLSLSYWCGRFVILFAVVALLFVFSHSTQLEIYADTEPERANLKEDDTYLDSRGFEKVLERKIGDHIFTFHRRIHEPFRQNSSAGINK